MGNKRVGPIKRIINKKIKEEIRRKEKIKGRRLDPRERARIKERVFRRIRTRATMFGIVGVLGVGGVVGINKIKDGPKELNQAIETDVGTAHDEFTKKLNIEIPEELIDEERTEIRHEIQELKTSDEILNYVKEIYVEQYNENNNTDIGIENIKFYKESDNKVFYEDENGILRYCTEKEYEEMGHTGIDGNLPMITATITNGEDKINEKVGQKQNGEIVNIYGKDEIVEKDEETTLTQLGRVVLTGINYMTAKGQEANTWDVKKKYEDRFVNAIAEYREQKNPEKENIANNEKQQEDDERY